MGFAYTLSKHILAMQANGRFAVYKLENVEIQMYQLTAFQDFRYFRCT